LEAYDDYLRGRDLIRTLEPDRVFAARRMFERAVAADPQFAPAWVGIAESCHPIYTWFKRDLEQLAAARHAAAEALRINVDFADAHVANGLAMFSAGAYPAAHAAFARARQLNPQNFDASYFDGRTFVSEGCLEDAATMFARAAALRWDDYQARSLLAVCYRGLKLHADEREVAESALDATMKRLQVQPSDVRAVYFAASNVWSAYHDRDQALSWALRALDMAPTSATVRFNVACVYTNVGAIDDALTLLEANVEQGWGQRAWLENDPDLRTLGNEPRFRAILARLTSEA
jgi:adenylate cyclase